MRSVLLPSPMAGLELSRWTPIGLRTDIPVCRLAGLPSPASGDFKTARTCRLESLLRYGTSARTTSPWVLMLAFTFAMGMAWAEELSAEQAAAARKVYAAKCAKCHRFYEPTNYAEPAWRHWMEAMSRKARLKRDQDALLSKYLDAYRAGRVTGLPK
jgi:hypothetical protein